MSKRSRILTVDDSRNKEENDTDVQSRPRLLLVDDERTNLRLLEALLQPHGYELITAQDGEECLKKVTDNEVDLVLLDIMMPGIDGYEVTRRIRSNESTRLLPIVIISALRETEDRVTGIEAGCDDFISKPFDKNEVLAKVQTTLKLSYYRRQLDEKEKFESLITKISEAIVVCGADWKIKRINTYGGEYLNGAKVGEDLVDCMFASYAVSIPRSELVDDLSPPSKRFTLAREERDGFKPLCLYANLDVLRDPAGKVSSFVLTLRDMTRERREEKLKGEFLSFIALKLRMPVSIVAQNASNLQDDTLGSLSEVQRESINSISAEAHVLTRLIEKLIRFSIVNSISIINSQTLDLPKEDIRLHSYLPKLVETKVKDSKDGHVKLNIDAIDKDARVRVSTVYFDSIILNLIENAMKFNDKKTTRIRVVVEKAEGKVAISISDNGPGIAPEERTKVFETFYQIDRDFAGNMEGAGLGLPLVKRLVTAYGGGICLKSDPDKGSTFTVTLPGE